MDCIQLMIDEHVYIKRMLKVVREASYKILQGNDINYDDFEKMIDFIRNYADKHHHGKEEILLFNRMIDEIGELAEKLIRLGMLIEHDYGRLYIMQLEEALKKVKNGEDFFKIDVVANAVGYTNLLERHIDKEDTLIFQFAKNNLCEETMDLINKECVDFEEEATKANTQVKYIKLVEELEAKYC